MVADADHRQPGSKAGFDVVTDVPVGMAAAEMMGMKVEFHRGLLLSSGGNLRLFPSRFIRN
ncbi:hypothetical protein D3C85_1914510 [compost metagenome]